MIVMGVNDDTLKPEHRIVSNASCTTNCLAPIAKVLDESFGIEQGVMTTVHAYTNDQRLADVPHKDLRRAPRRRGEHHPDDDGRRPRGGQGAAGAQGKARRDGDAGAGARRLDRRPGRRAEADVTVEEVNAAVRRGRPRPPLKGFVEYCEEPIVSSDVIRQPLGDLRRALARASISGGYIKVVAWYDNEWGYSSRVVDLIGKLAAL